MKSLKKLFSLLLLFNILFCNYGISYAAEDSNVEQNITVFETYLREHETNVIEQLISSKEQLLEKIELESDPEVCIKLQEQVEVYEELISNYQLYKQKNNVDLGLRASVAAIVSYFNFQGYDLSAELLSHAYNNKTVDSYYEPINGSRAFQSSIIQKIRFNNKFSGSDTFPNNGDKIDKDLYYGIHDFDYFKTSGRLLLRDRYDYEDTNYGGIADAAVNTMYLAQQMGVIVPFQVYIYLPL